VVSEARTSVWRDRAYRLTRETYAVARAARHPRVPWYAKLLIVGIVAYALSPIDLIPDFLPIVGHLDDLVIVPAGIALAIRMIPPDVLDDCRAAASSDDRSPRHRIVGALIVLVIWAVVIVGVGLALRHVVEFS
jgi:uncharacterized membrane protein YkvA (DUF1232 family)